MANGGPIHTDALCIERTSTCTWVYRLGVYV